MTNNIELIDQFLYRLTELDIKLWVDGERLRCTAPKGVLTAELQAGIGARKAEILTFLQNNQRPRDEDQIKSVPRNGPLPLSFAQQRLWFLNQLEPNSAFYNIPSTLRLEGPLDVAAVEQSFDSLIARHESLRTTFEMALDNNEPVQLIHEHSAFTLPLIQMENMEEAQRCVQVESTMPFDLQNGPLLRVQLLKITETDHLLLLTMHHIISDGWSMGIVVDEFSRGYTAHAQGTFPTLPKLPVQYADFAIWQREYLSGTLLDAQLSYWRTRLADAPALLELPTDRPRPAVQSYQGAYYTFQLTADHTAKLRQLAQRHDATLFMVLLAAFNVLLSRYSRQTDIVVGSPIANRNRVEVEGLIGFFVNTLVFRTDLSDNPSFTALLARVRENTLADYRHQDLPFEQLVDELQLERTLSYTPLFQAMLVLQNAVLGEVVLPNVAATIESTESPFARFDLNLNLIESSTGLSGRFEYSTDLFDKATIARMTSHFTALLHSILSHPDQPICQLPMLADAEYHQIIHEWNDTAIDFGEPQTIHALFEQQARRTPDAIAILGDSQLTYRELNIRANELAHYLIELGVRADTLVAVAMERSSEMIVSLLAILKAGGAYVPIDPTYPDQRIRYMLADSSASILLTQSHLLSGVEADHVIAVDTMDDQLILQPAQNPLVSMSPKNLAYVIYTSGSTGNPKGVALEHRSVFNYLQWCIATYGISTGNGTLVHSPLAFDLTVTSIWSPLLVGNTLHLLPEDDAIDTLVNALTSLTDLSFVKLTPAHLQLINHQLSPEQFRGRAQALIIGGEALHRSVVEPWLQFAPETQLINEYGPTEATVGTIIYTASPTDSGEWVKIGKPIANTQIYILDEYHAAVPIGVSGELYIGGTQLARGYLNRPELTQERFIKHPQFGRLYKTGDLCRWLPDGTMEYIGRTDFQVKIRGFRIELGEVESALLALEGVDEAAVLMREDNPGTKRLVAYLVGDTDIVTLRQHLAERLPDYMVPSAFVSLEAMPLTPNGKLDRYVLPAPEYADGETEFMAPRDNVETALAQAFADALHIPKVGIHDNFFHMGGDSIVSIQVVSRIAQQGYSVQVKDIFQYPTIAALATVVGIDDGSQVVASQAVQVGESPLLPIQRWFLASDQPQMYHFNHAFLLQVTQPLDRTTLETALGTLLHHHDALRFQYSRDGSGWRQTYLESIDQPPLEMVDLQHIFLAQRSAEIEKISAQTQTSLDPHTGDLVRFVYFHAGTDWSRLLIVIHHLAVDGVSWRILVEDLITLLDGKTLLPKTSSYRDWAETLQAATNAGDFDVDIPYWLEKSHEDVILPLDQPQALNTMGNSHQLTLTLSQTESEHLRRTLPDLHDVTLDGVILTALTETLVDWCSASRDHSALRVKFESHGRQELFDTIDLSRTLGWFTSAYPMSLPHFQGSAVKRIRYTLEQLRSVPEGGISFGALHDFHPDEVIRKQFAALPAPPVIYNYLGQFDSLANDRFGIAPESIGESISPAFQRDALIEINGIIVDGQLQIEWTVSPQLQYETAESLLAAFRQQLDTLITEALQPHEPVVIPSDFVDANLSFDQLESIFDNSTKIETIYRLSPMQAGMLFHSQLTPNHGTYIEHTLFHVDDPAFDPSRFTQAIQQVIDHHESLRATFRSQQDSKAVQVIHKQAQLPVTRFDWQNLSDASYQTSLSSLIETDRLTDFDFSQAPLMRLAIIERNDEQYGTGHDLLFTFHHIIMDRWALDLFWASVLRAYDGLPLPTATPYQSYIHHLGQKPVDQDFWQTYLSGFYAPTPLPAAITTEAQSKLATITQPLSLEATEQLAAFARMQGVTLNTLYQAAWGLLLARYTNESDVVFGTVMSGRTAPIGGIDAILGLFINTLPFRMQFETGLTGTALLEQVAQTQLALQQREHTPLLDVQQWSDVPAGTNLFDSLLLFQNTPQTAGNDDDGAASGFALRTGWVDPGETGYPLEISVAPGQPSKPTMLEMNYDTAHYEAETIQRMLSHFQILLLGIIADPTADVMRLPMLTEVETQQLLVEWNDTQADYPLTSTFPELFAQQVKKTPHAIAATSHQSPTTNHQITYAELDLQSTQIAQWLLYYKSTSESVVALLEERGITFLTAMIGILKAGCAYLPLDPNYPAQRLSQVMGSSQAPIVLATQATRSQLDQTLGNHECQILLLEDLLRGSPPITYPLPRCYPDELAYIIYTSGSTGVPKGAMLEHKGLLNHLYCMIDELDLTAQDVVLQNASQSFDISVWQFLTSLLIGGRIHIVNDETAREPNLLLDTVIKEKVTIFELVPTLLRLILDKVAESPPATSHQPPATSHQQPTTNNQLSKLRWLIPTGEALPPELCRRWLTAFPHVSMLNAYGPSECSDDVTLHVIDQPPALDVINMPIGRPVANMRTYILDSTMQPVPIGVAGEIYIAGIGVGRGYLNDSTQTARAFMTDPFDPTGQGRFYKTGDLARYLPPSPDGQPNMEFLGRVDHQVKMRGFRIELGEIENVLLSRDDLREAAVIVREDSPGDQRLVAYFVGDGDRDILRQHLATRLPAYMVPSAFMKLEHLPLTPNGKLDRRALPVPDYADAQTAFVPPRNGTEQQLAEIWREVLDIEQVGVYDNFFALGGHSLLATQVISRVRMQLDLEVPLKTLFDAPQLATFAQAIGQESTTALAGGSIEPIERSDQSFNRFPLSFAQQRLWFLDQLEPGSAFYNIPATLRLTGELDVLALEQSFNYLITRHESLRTTFEHGFQPGDEEAMQVIHAVSAFSKVHLSVISVVDENEAQQRGLAEANTPFDLYEGPLLRVLLCKIAERDQLLVLNMHHIISDGWSVDVLVEEFTHAYSAYTAGTTPTLPDLAIQYADFAHWQRHWLTGDVLARQLDYWRDHLDGSPTRLELLTDRPRPPIQTYNGSSVTFQLDPQLAEQIRLLSQESRIILPGDQQPGASLFMIFYTAFAMLLGRYSGQEDIVIGTPIANRNRAEIEPLIGFFVNTLALRTDLSGDPTFLELLEQVRQQTLDAYTHQDIPFEQLVEELQPERSLSHSPIFQVLFSWQHMSRHELSLPGLEVMPLVEESVGAKFELDLDMQEVAGQIQGIMEYNTDLFDVETIQRMVSHFQTLLQGIVSNPSAPIATLPLMTEAEEQQILVDWNQTQTDYPLSTTFPELFARQVEKTPHAIAATFSTSHQPPTTNYQITYAELDAQSTQIAQWLLHYKLAPESVVALLEERGIAFLTAMVAILKAGCVYLPVDPNYPAERISRVVESSQAPIVLATEATRFKIEGISDVQGDACQILLLEELLQNAPPIDYPLPRCQPDDLAYVIYTSGSTGVPKGAMLEHKGLLNHLYSKHEDLSLTDQDVILQNASQSFDISVWQFLAGLLVGSRIHIVDDEIARDPRLLLDEVTTEQVTNFELVPSLLRMILDMVEEGQSASYQLPTTNYQPPSTNDQLPKLRWLIPTGEALPPELCRRWLSAFPEIPMLNAYGPSECSDDVTLHVISEPPPSDVVNMPIGRPIANMRVYILDKEFRPVPIGVAGELYIAGVGVGRGYLNDSEQTEKAFMTDPFDPTGQGRFYKTGDLARYLSVDEQWNIEFLGRVDHQVKVRGFRIELGEIESALADHRAVRENVVVAWENGTTELVAYIAPDGEWATQWTTEWNEDDQLPDEVEASLVTELRNALRQQLPDYMVPTAFVFLKTLPLTPNGKIDRRALPLPTRSAALESYVPPHTPVEELLATAWASVLNHERVGIYDNFFDLGGHSLLAVQVVARIREHFQIEFTVRQIFETPTIAEISAHIEVIQQTIAQRLDILAELAEDEEELEL